MTKIWFPDHLLRGSAGLQPVRSLVCLALECLAAVDGGWSQLVGRRLGPRVGRKLFDGLLRRREMSEPLLTFVRSAWREADFVQLDVGGFVRLSLPAVRLVGSLAALTRLDVRGNDSVDDAAVSLWAESAAFRLEHVDVSMCRQLSDRGVRAIVHGMTSLRHLIAADLPLLGDASCRELAASPIAATIESVDVSRTRLTDAGVAALARPLVRQSVLLLGDCSDSDGRYAPLLLALGQLKIAGNAHVTDASAPVLAQAFPSLTAVDVSGTQVSAAAFDRLVASLVDRQPASNNRRLGPGLQFSMPSDASLLASALPVRQRTGWNSLLFTSFLADYGWHDQRPVEHTALAASSTNTRRIYATISAYLDNDNHETPTKSQLIDTDKSDDVIQRKTARRRQPGAAVSPTFASLLDDSSDDDDHDDDDDADDEQRSAFVGAKRLRKR